ncbi:MAG: pilus assembly FimT family protein [Syntrophales bacterium]
MRTPILRVGQISSSNSNVLFFHVPPGNLRGFTLLELIVVLIIISLMSALVVPKLAGPMSNLDLKTASKKIAASLRYVRSHAASEKRTAVALFDFDKNRLVIIDTPLIKGDFQINNQEAFDKTPIEPPNSEKDGPGGSKTYHLPDGVKLAKGVSREGEVTSGFFRISFFPSGGSSGGEITVANERGKLYKITVDFITGATQLSEVAG